ncbi:hypothetical protein P027_03193 [Enterococcus faecalis EnGen0427]|nr:hypothetical protein P027_03193 [Enterococcus faecalis EnGen0427]
MEKAKKELNIKEQVTLNILTNEEDLSKKLGEYLQGQLEENLKGLKITITPVPANVQIERVMKHDFTISLSGWQADFADPVSFLANFESKSVLNFGGYSNTKYDEYLKDTSDKRWKSLKKAEELILEDAGVIPLLQIGNAKLRNQR